MDFWRCLLYQTAKGWLVNADAQAAANCLRKVSTQLGLDLAKVVKECLTVPKRYNLDSLAKLYRKRAEARIYEGLWPRPA
ncbi:MAG: hypothetical protein AB4060_07135 [Crocosphaera sp.]